MKKRFCVFCSLLILGFQLFGAGLLAYPRKINLLKTQHFDILYTDDSVSIVMYIADNADNFFAKAQYELETQNSFRMPVVISPDSDILSVKYSSYPYNRLVVFDGVPEINQSGFEDILGSMLYKEIYLAVAESIMSPFNQVIHKTIGGEKYTPASLFNLPSSFIEGYGYLIQSEMDYRKIGDDYFLQLLSEAKLEGKFPTWFQTFATRDIYPGDNLSNAAGTAFAAYLIQSRGIEKYNDFWHECGKLHPFFAAGIIRKVYGVTIQDLWEEFENSVPLPKTLDSLYALESDIEVLFQNTHSNYNQLVYSDLGLIWYDDLRHEVDILDTKRKKLFSAEGIRKLSVSPDGRYLTVSFIQSKKENNVQKNITWVYDLLEKIFIEDVYKLRDAAVIVLPDGTNAIAGINTEDGYPVLQIYTSRNFGSEKNELIYEEAFEKNIIPASVSYASKGKLFYLVAKADVTNLVLLELDNNKKRVYEISDINENPLIIKNLVYQNKGLQLNEQELFTFQYSVKKDNSFVRTGYFIFDDEPAAVSLQTTDIKGGINYPVIQDSKIYFTSRQTFHDELESIPVEKLDFQPGRISCMEKKDAANQLGNRDVVEPYVDTAEYNISKYSLLTYWHRFSLVPFIPIDDISFEEGAHSAPGLGVLLKLVPDPFMNNKFTVSAAWDFLNLDFVWILNAPTEQEKLVNQNNQKDGKTKTFAFYYENTSTPVEIKAGSVFRFNMDGQYDFDTLAGVSWTLPLGFTFNELIFDVYGEYLASTDYYDANLSDTYTSLSNFPGFKDAYETVNVSAAVQFKNIHQFGSSSFEQKGFSAGFSIYSLWDLYKIRNLPKGTINVNQLFFGIQGSIALPYLLPLKPNKDGWIFTLPTTASINIASKAGVVLDSNIEMLLVGKEVQNGIPYINMYFNRIGLKFGCDFSLKYDTSNIQLPDFRRFDYTYNILNCSKPKTDFYILLNMDFLFPIGPLSKKVITSNFKTTFYPDTNGFSFNLDFGVNF